MKANKILGIILIVAGLVMLGASFYIKNQVLQGRAQISSAQGKVDAGKSIFSVSPTTKQVGDGLFGGAQRQIDAGSAEANYYANMANGLQIGGIIAILVGAVILFFARKKHH